MGILRRPDHIRTPIIPIPMLQAHIGLVGASIPAFRLLGTTGDTGTPDIGPVEGAGTNLVSVVGCQLSGNSVRQRPRADGLELTSYRLLEGSIECFSSRP